MASIRCFLCVAALTLMVVAVETSSGGGQQQHSYDLSGQRLTDVYNSRVFQVERMRRPLGRLPFAVGQLSHCGVRVTLADGSKYLIHKGGGYGISSQTVVTDARHMSSAWETIKTKNYQGRKTVSDLVKAGGPEYHLLRNNCHKGCSDMMNQ